jgi:rhamnose transport system ATP-binding protein
VTILRDGAVVTTRERAGLSPDDAIRLMVGRAVVPASPAAHAHGDIALEPAGVTSGAAGVDNISLRVRHGEVVALAGLVGSGRTELAEIIAGLSPCDSGTIAVDRRVVAPQSVPEAIAAGIGYLPEDRLRHGVIAEMSVAANTSLASLGSVSRTGFIDTALETRLAETYVGRFRIKTTGVDRPVGDLSGGNQPKVALARWLATRPKVLIV